MTRCFIVPVVGYILNGEKCPTANANEIDLKSTLFQLEGASLLSLEMIIPVKCFTCGKVLADKWSYYVEACKRLDNPAPTTSGGGVGNETTAKESSRAPVFDALQLDRICCRRHMLGHVDMIDVI